MIVLKCKICGGDIELTGNSTGECRSCGCTVTLPRIDDDVRADMYNRGNYYRMKYDFERAASAYEHIIAREEKDAEAHFCLALCHYGIEYVRDPRTGEYKPACHKGSYHSILEDIDYQKSLQYADACAASIYRQEAEKIHTIQQEILDISRREPPYDVFICYKESRFEAAAPGDRGRSEGERTPDSVLAQDIYDKLTERGLRVFFSRITLENKLGSAYEPHIFAALRSAKVMLLVTTRRDYAESVWVKNEWQRYLELLKTDREKNLIPVIRGIEAYDLPDELAGCHPINIDEMGAMQDLIRGVLKLTDHLEGQGEAIRSRDLEDYLLQMLADRNYESAGIVAEQLLNRNPENARYHLYRLFVQYEVSELDVLKDSGEQVEESADFQRYLRYAVGEEKREAETFLLYRKKRASYLEGERLEADGAYEKALEAFRSAGDYKDARDREVQVRVKAEEVIRKRILAENIKKYKDELENTDKTADRILQRDYAEKLKQNAVMRKKAEDNPAAPARNRCTILAFVLFDVAVIGWMCAVKRPDTYMDWVMYFFFGVLVYAAGRLIPFVRYIMKRDGVLPTFIGISIAFMLFSAGYAEASASVGGNHRMPELFPGLAVSLMAAAAVNLAVSLGWFLNRWAKYKKKLKQQRDSENSAEELKKIRERICREVLEDIRRRYEPLIGKENL